MPFLKSKTYVISMNVVSVQERFSQLAVLIYMPELKTKSVSGNAGRQIQIDIQFSETLLYDQRSSQV